METPSIRRMDNTGDTLIQPESLSAAVEVVNEHLENDGWAFLDGQMVGNGKVTGADLQGIGNVVLSEPIIGG